MVCRQTLCLCLQGQKQDPGKSEKSNLRAILGKATMTHGNAGSIRVKFSKNLPPTAMGMVKFYF